jgi:hypothetical protein
MQTDIRHDGAPSHGTTGQHTIGAAIWWGLLFGGMQAASPLVVWWLAPGTVYAISLILIAPISIGFAVADGRPIIIAVESSVAAQARSGRKQPMLGLVQRRGRRGRDPLACSAREGYQLHRDDRMHPHHPRGSPLTGDGDSPEQPVHSRSTERHLALRQATSDI